MRGENIDLFTDWLKERIRDIAAERLAANGLFDEREASLTAIIEKEVGGALNLVVGISLPRVDSIDGQPQKCRISCLVAIKRNAVLAASKNSYELARDLFCNLHATHYSRSERQLPNVMCHNLAHSHIDGEMLHTFDVTAEAFLY